VSQMLTTEIAACCKELKLSRNMVEMADRVQADSHPEYLLKLLRSELEHRETQRKDKFLKNAGFYSIKTFDGFRFDEVTLPAAVSPDYLRELRIYQYQNQPGDVWECRYGQDLFIIALGVEACKGD